MNSVKRRILENPVLFTVALWVGAWVVVLWIFGPALWWQKAAIALTALATIGLMAHFMRHLLMDHTRYLQTVSTYEGRIKKLTQELSTPPIIKKVSVESPPGGL